MYHNIAIQFNFVNLYKAVSFVQYFGLFFSETSSLTCPLCCKRNWQQFENDMWRLEQWLSLSEATQSMQKYPATGMEQIEEASQDHRVRF